MATDAFYEDWFERFEAKLAREDPEDLDAPYVNLNRPEDRQRMLIVTDEGAIQPALPLTGEITDDQKEILYNAARDGRLMVIPLGGVRPLQATLEDGNELVKRDDLGKGLNIQYLGPELVEPKPRELNFFKNILNALFGAFQEEKDRYIDEYNAECDKYLRNVSAYMFVNTVTAPGSTFQGDRDKQMQINKEFWRRKGRELLSETENVLNDESIPQWKRDAFEIKKTLLTEVIDGGAKTYTQKEVHTIVTKLALNTLLSDNEKLAQEVEKDPQQMQALMDVIGMSQSVREQVAFNATVNNSALMSCAFSDNIVGDLAGNFKEELRQRRAAAKTLVNDGLMEAVPNNLEGDKKLFNNPKIDERITQLLHARSMIPGEKLQQLTVEKTKDLVREGKELVWTHEKTTGLENRHGISLDDPRVTETFYNLREAAKNEPAKVNDGPAVSISG